MERDIAERKCDYCALIGRHSKPSDSVPFSGWIKISGALHKQILSITEYDFCSMACLRNWLGEQ